MIWNPHEIADMAKKRKQDRLVLHIKFLFLLAQHSYEQCVKKSIEPKFATTS